MTLKSQFDYYELKVFVKGDTTTYEVWGGWKGGWFRPRRDYKLKVFASIDAAEKYISNFAGGFYDRTFYYGPDGAPSLRGWA